MKKILIVAAMFACTTAFADTGAAAKQKQTQTTEVTTVSGAQSTSTGGSVGNTAATVGNTSTNGTVTVGCLVNCADQSTAAREAGAADIQVALIQAAVAKEIAAANAAAAKEIAGTTQTIKNTPSVSGPALVTSNDTCMGSTSGSVNIAGLGIGGGTSWVDNNCKMLKNSRELWNMGMKGAAMALMCTDAANREALELTGFECPQTTKAKADAKKVAEAQTTEYTDPIVRARLGLPEVTAAAK